MIWRLFVALAAAAVVATAVLAVVSAAASVTVVVVVYGVIGTLVLRAGFAWRRIQADLRARGLP